MARLWFCPSIVQYTRTRKLKSRIDSLEKKLKCQDTRRQSTTRSSELSALRPGRLSGLGSTGSDSIFQSNTWWSLTKVSPMSEEFHDWLDKCPVIWIRDRVEKDHVFYAFETPSEEDDED